MAQGHFNIMNYVAGASHETAHIATAALAAGLLVVFGVAGRFALGKGDAAVLPAGKFSIKGFWEALTAFMVWMGDMVLGHHGRKYLPFFGTIFIYVFFSNLIGLLPGFASSTQDFNTGFAVGIVSFLFYNYVGFKESGIKYLHHFVGELPLGMILLWPLIFVIELISNSVRPVSLALRLSGNMTGDHTVLGIFLEKTPILVPVVFYGLGLFVCFVQAFVFTLLSMVYVMMVSHHD